MASRDARLLLVEGTRGDGSVIDRESFGADTRIGVEQPGFRDQVVSAVIDTRAAAPANGYTVARVALTWTDAVSSEARLVLDALEELGLTNVAVVSSADALEAAAGSATHTAESPGGESNSALNDDATLLLARGALIASADIRDEAAPAVKPAALTHTLAMAVATAVLIVAGSAFLAMTVRGGHDTATPPQASTPAGHPAPAPPTEPVHTVVRKVVPMVGRAADKSLLAPHADTSLPPVPGVVRR
ncbi:hypothetical protein [Mycolicibacterium neworleansense]|nr:hypothetical protein [Mycolicibacterium neworleansense]